MAHRGLVARILAGHDAGRYCVILEDGDQFVPVADGKRRRLSKPKRKNLRHLELTSTTLEEDVLSSDRRLRRALHPFHFPADHKL